MNNAELAYRAGHTFLVNGCNKLGPQLFARNRKLVASVDPFELFMPFLSVLKSVSLDWLCTVLPTRQTHPTGSLPGNMEGFPGK